MHFGTSIAQLAQVPLVLPFAQTNDGSPFSTVIETLIEQSMHRYQVPGLAIAVVSEDSIFSRGFGIANLPDIPVTPETMFYGASTTKAFITAAMSLIVDDDDMFPNVKWQTPIHQIIPDDFVLEDNYSTFHLTLEDAATHRTGMPRHDFSVRGGNETVKEVVQSLRYLPLTEPLRTTFQYCNLMFVMLGHVIESLVGRWTGHVLAEWIWKPLNMTSTYFSLSDAIKSGNPLAEGYYWRTASQTFTRVDWIDETAIEGAGAVISSVEDYAKWVKMMLNRANPISKAGHEALVTPRMLEGRSTIPDTYVFYGYGWEISWYRGHEIISHNGGETGFGALVRYIPDKQWGCVMMGNTMTTSNLVQEILAWHLIDDLLETPELERINLTSLIDNYIAQSMLERNVTYVKELLYPANETTYAPPSLPLKAYAGSYHHPGYGEWPIIYENETLWNPMNRTSVLVYKARLDHITGDSFLMYGSDAGEPDDFLFIPVEFKIDGSGVVRRMGLEMEDSMKGEKIWFDKC